MKNDIKILYKHLMSSFQHERLGWYRNYKKIIKNIEKIKENLENEDLSLKDEQVYTGTDFKNHEELLKKMFANTGNGVSSNGQSIFSDKDFKTARDNEKFLAGLKSLILEPSEENHDSFANIWNEVLNKNNPVQTNRATAACNLNFSSTVDSGKFNQVYNWLVKHKYLENGEHTTWYSRNIHLIDYIREELTNVDGRDFEEVNIDNYWINIFVWLIFENLSNPFSLKKQVIKYGAPGTGKTYHAKEITKMQFSIWKNAYGNQSDLEYENVCEFVQFHPSFSYEDFIEGLRPKLDSEKKLNSNSKMEFLNRFALKPGNGRLIYTNGVLKRVGTI